MTAKTAKKTTTKPKTVRVAKLPELPRMPFAFEVFDLASKQRSKAKKRSTRLNYSLQNKTVSGTGLYKKLILREKMPSYIIVKIFLLVTLQLVQMAKRFTSLQMHQFQVALVTQISM